MKLISGLLLLVCLISCKTKSNKAAEQEAAIKYEVVSNWPQLPDSVTLGQPTGVGVDNNDHIFVFCRAGRRWTEPFPDSTIAANTILELDNETGKLINSWGAHLFIMPHGLTVDAQNNIWVTDVALHQVFKFSHDGQLLLKLGIAKMPGNDSLHFNLPTDVAVEADGTFYVSDGYGNCRVVKFSPEGTFIKTWGTYGSRPGEFIIPHGIALDKKHVLYVADRQNNRVQLFDTSGNFLQLLNNNVMVQQVPSIAVDGFDKLFAIDYDPRKRKDSSVMGSTIFAFDSLQHILYHMGATGTAERTSSWFHDIAIDHKGNLYVGDITGLKLIKFKPKP
jgi:peptidylamidoglycolate lyase